MQEEHGIRHVGIIMDGNGRWATEHNKPRNYGHMVGYEVFQKIASYAYSRGIEVVSVYAFSTENWARPEAEVKKLMSLFGKALTAAKGELEKKKAHLLVSGELDKLNGKTAKKLAALMSDTEKYAPRTLNICFNYGSRTEIVSAFNKMAADGITVCDDKTISNYLYTKGLPDVDLVIRTGGEQRLSNFLLWQASYAELYFTDVFWPEFTEVEFDKALNWYYGRNRRFGKVAKV